MEVHIRGFIYGGTPMAGCFTMEHPTKLDDLGVCPFQETSIMYIYIYSHISYYIVYVSIVEGNDKPTNITADVNPATVTSLGIRCGGCLPKPRGTDPEGMFSPRRHLSIHPSIYLCLCTYILIYIYIVSYIHTNMYV